MRRIPRMLTLLTLLSGLCFSVLAFSVWIKPSLKAYATRQMSTLLKQSNVKIQYQDISLIWAGFRIEGLELTSSQMRSFGSVDVHLKLWPGRGFARPDRITLKRSRITLLRVPSSSEQVIASQRSSQAAADKSVSPLLDRLQGFLKTGINLELQQVRFEVLDSQREPVLLVEKLDAWLSASEQIMEIQLKGFRYRDKEILQGLDGQLILQAKQGRLPFFVTAREEGSEPWQLQGSLGEDLDSIELRHKRIGLPLAWRPFLRSVEPQEKIELLLKMQVDGLKESQDLDFDVQIASNNLEINHPLLSSERVGPWPFTMRAQGRFNPERGSLEVRKGLIYVLQAAQKAQVKSHFTLVKSDLLKPMTLDPWRISWRLPETDCQALLKVLPQGAFPLLRGFELSGSMQLSAEIELFPQKARAIDFPRDKQAFSCRVKAAPEIFTKSWVQKRQMSSTAQFMQKSPNFRAFTSADFVPIGKISEDFLHGVVAAEDASFWQHEGVRTSALTAAFQANLKAGKVLFGGSTITMQMVKNFYLNHEKVLSRKLQELIISWALEQVLDKQDILEVYANIIEFGPGIFGIGKASQAYFNKEPHQLSTAEALFLASILPSPGRHYRESFCQGQLSAAMQERMQKVATGLASLQPGQQLLDLYQKSLHRFQFEGKGRCPKDNQISRRKEPQTPRPF